MSALLERTAPKCGFANSCPQPVEWELYTGQFTVLLCAEHKQRIAMSEADPGTFVRVEEEQS